MKEPHALRDTSGGCAALFPVGVRLYYYNALLLSRLRMFLLVADLIYRESLYFTNALLGIAIHVI